MDFRQSSEAAEDPTVKARITATGQDVLAGGPDALAETLKRQAAAAAAVAKIIGIARKN